MQAAAALLAVFRGYLVHDRFLLGLFRDLSIRAAGKAQSADRAQAVSAKLQNVSPRCLLAIVFHGVVLVLRLLVFLGRFPVLVEVTTHKPAATEIRSSRLGRRVATAGKFVLPFWNWRVAATECDISEDVPVQS